jgi:hypothetical protein
VTDSRKSTHVPPASSGGCGCGGGGGGGLESVLSLLGNPEALASFARAIGIDVPTGAPQPFGGEGNPSGGFPFDVSDDKKQS